MKLEDVLKERVEELVLKKKISINALANQMGVNSTTIKNILYGKSCNPTILTIFLISSAFEMTLSEFFKTEEFEDPELEAGERKPRKDRKDGELPME